MNTHMPASLPGMSLGLLIQLYVGLLLMLIHFVNADTVWKPMSGTKGEEKDSCQAEIQGV